MLNFALRWYTFIFSSQWLHTYRFAVDEWYEGPRVRPERFVAFSQTLSKFHISFSTARAIRLIFLLDYGYAPQLVYQKRAKNAFISSGGGDCEAKNIELWLQSGAVSCICSKTLSIDRKNFKMPRPNVKTAKYSARSLFRRVGFDITYSFSIDDLFHYFSIFDIITHRYDNIICFNDAVTRATQLLFPLMPGDGIHWGAEAHIISHDMSCYLTRNTRQTPGHYATADTKNGAAEWPPIRL